MAAPAATATHHATGLRQTTMHEITVRTDSWSWARLLWDDKGRVIILSDFGCWSHFWGHRGKGTSVPAFLVQVDRDYAGGKMLWPNASEFDAAASVRSAKTKVLSLRRSEHLTREEAREDWDELDLVDSEMGFTLWAAVSHLDDPHVHYHTRLAACWCHFWERLWVPHLLPALQAIVAQEVA